MSRPASCGLLLRIRSCSLSQAMASGRPLALRASWRNVLPLNCGMDSSSVERIFASTTLWSCAASSGESCGDPRVIADAIVTGSDL